MNSKLLRKLRREVLSSPKKAAALGLLLLVAIYYWSGLVTGWLGGGSKPAATITAAVVPAAGATVSASTNIAAPRVAPPSSWKQIAALIDADAQMMPAVAMVSSRDPFAAEVKIETPKSEVAVKAPPTVTPQQAGITLTSTMISSRKSVALVNGQTYEVGEIIEVGVDGERLSFVLAEVHSKSIVLEREGSRYELELASARLGGKDRLNLIQTDSARQ